MSTSVECLKCAAAHVTLLLPDTACTVWCVAMSCVVTAASSQGIGHQLAQTMKHRILILDGAMGTMIQKLELSEEDFRGVIVLCVRGVCVDVCVCACV